MKHIKSFSILILTLLLGTSFSFAQDKPIPIPVKKNPATLKAGKNYTMATFKDFYIVADEVTLYNDRAYYRLHVDKKWNDNWYDNYCGKDELCHLYKVLLDENKKIINPLSPYPFICEESPCSYFDVDGDGRNEILITFKFTSDQYKKTVKSDYQLAIVRMMDIEHDYNLGFENLFKNLLPLDAYCDYYKLEPKSITYNYGDSGADILIDYDYNGAKRVIKYLVNEKYPYVVSSFTPPTFEYPENQRYFFKKLIIDGRTCNTNEFKSVKISNYDSNGRLINTQTINNENRVKHDFFDCYKVNIVQEELKISNIKKAKYQILIYGENDDLIYKYEGDDDDGYSKMTPVQYEYYPNGSIKAKIEYF